MTPAELTALERVRAAHLLGLPVYLRLYDGRLYRPDAIDPSGCVLEVVCVGIVDGALDGPVEVFTNLAVGDPLTETFVRMVHTACPDNEKLCARHGLQLTQLRWKQWQKADLVITGVREPAQLPQRFYVTKNREQARTR